MIVIFSFLDFLIDPFFSFSKINFWLVMKGIVDTFDITVTSKNIIFTTIVFQISEMQ